MKGNLKLFQVHFRSKLPQVVSVKYTNGKKLSGLKCLCFETIFSIVSQKYGKTMKVLKKVSQRHRGFV